MALKCGDIVSNGILINSQNETIWVYGQSSQPYLKSLYTQGSYSGGDYAFVYKSGLTLTNRVFSYHRDK